MRDLDIRGSGDLLGADQSGFINDIGFETYQKILDEAIKELKREQFQELFKDAKEQLYIKDCQLDTDLEILIPENYVSSISERINLYKELNNFTTEKEIASFLERLKDRFGNIPNSMHNIFDALRLRWFAQKIGFERIILKNNKMLAYFPLKSNSEYYNSHVFQKVLEYLKQNFENCKIAEKKDKLSIIIKNINNLKEALKICKNILNV